MKKKIGERVKQEGHEGHRPLLPYKQKDERRRLQQFNIRDAALKNHTPASLKCVFKYFCEI